MQFNKGFINNLNIPKRNLLLIIFAAIISQTIFIVASSQKYHIGFPLDDAWIHQTYARNIALTLKWEYIPGIISGGSTSPLWTILLVPGHLFGGKFYLYWTYFLSFTFFAGSAIFFEKILRLKNYYNPKFPLAGLLFCLEWHIVWAACSGMETILFIFLLLLFSYFLLLKPTHFYHGLIIIALLVWVRPDGLTLLGPWLLIFAFDVFKTKIPIKTIVSGLIILFSSITIYILFNYFITGSYFPNTFYAKQAEYAVYYQATLLSRFLKMTLIPLTGIGVLLLPGFIYQIIECLRKKEIRCIGMILWFLGYLSIYAVRLPVTYQHGRYIIPAIPVFLFLSLFGYYSIQNIKSIRTFDLLKKAWKIAIFLILFIFFYLGFDAFSTDVAIIESEMVNTSNWIKLNTEKDVIVGAHDIGALGFFGEREIIDLAGLITPEVIPFIRDEEKLAIYLDENKADLLMTFPGWYPELIKNKKIIFSTGSIYSPLSGGENMTIYNWHD